MAATQASAPVFSIWMEPPSQQTHCRRTHQCSARCSTRPSGVWSSLFKAITVNDERNERVCVEWRLCTDDDDSGVRASGIHYLEMEPPLLWVSVHLVDTSDLDVLVDELSRGPCRHYSRRRWSTDEDSAVCALISQWQSPDNIPLLVLHSDASGSPLMIILH